MLNDTEKVFICHLANFLPDRNPSKRGPKPIPKEILLEQLFILARDNCGWRKIKHSSTCRNYLYKIQRRGQFKEFLNFITKDYKDFRVKKSIIDSSDVVSYKSNGLAKYSGKYHNYCIKITVEINKDYVPIDFSIDRGSKSDSRILEEMLNRKKILPYELYLDKGYENYERRRKLKKRNCQVRMEMKNYDNNRKRGPRFRFTDRHKRTRVSIEKIFGWLKSFKCLLLNRLRTKSLFTALFIICLSYYAFRRISKF
jgi:hypothetical protein